MPHWEKLGWYAGHIGAYTREMFPCMAAAVLVYLCLRPARKVRLLRLGLVSRPEREAVVLIFFMYGAGLSALTLFPAHFWARFMDWVTVAHREPFDWRALYPDWASITTETVYRNLFTPFQEIRRGLRGGPWIFFILLGNIGIFLPLGFLTALLWRRPACWKSTLMGLLSSCVIEFIQLFIGRSTDIDDVILNTLGAFGGYWLFRVFRLLCPVTASRFQCHTREDVPNE